MMRTRF